MSAPPLALAVLALVVIVFGAFVRLTDAGLGCPDWPGCYGRPTVPAAAATIDLSDERWRGRALETSKAWREMIHRYLAAALGLGIVVLAVAAWSRRHDATIPLLLVPLVIFQGLLGMWTVTLLLKPVVVCAHLIGGLTILALLWWYALDPRSAGAGASRPRLQRGVQVALAVLALQAFLGGWTSANYAALACTDFPMCQGRWWPETDFGEAFVLWRGLEINYEYGVLETPARTSIHMVHRLGAVLAVLVIAGVALAALRSAILRLQRIAWCILAALAFQVAMGITNIVAGLPLATAVAHNFGAAVLLLTLVSLLHATRTTD